MHCLKHALICITYFMVKKVFKDELPNSYNPQKTNVKLMNELRALSFLPVTHPSTRPLYLFQQYKEAIEKCSKMSFESAPFEILAAQSRLLALPMLPFNSQVERSKRESSSVGFLQVWNSRFHIHIRYLQEKFIGLFLLQKIFLAKPKSARMICIL